MATATPAVSNSLSAPEGRARIDRLRSLIAQLEQSPASGRREAVLREVRARVVTLDAGSQMSSAWRAKYYDRPDDSLSGLLNN